MYVADALGIRHFFGAKPVTVRPTKLHEIIQDNEAVFLERKEYNK